MTAAGDSEAGVVLVEVLVAFAILIGVIAAGFQIFGDGLHRSRLAAERAAEVTEAAALLVSLPQIKPGSETVEGWNGQSFTVKVTALRSQAAVWVARRPVRIEIFAGADTKAPPLIDTVLLESEGL